jgi:hypothetical protein
MGFAALGPSCQELATDEELRRTAGTSVPHFVALYRVMQAEQAEQALPRIEISPGLMLRRSSERSEGGRFEA